MVRFFVQVGFIFYFLLSAYLQFKFLPYGYWESDNKS